MAEVLSVNRLRFALVLAMSVGFWAGAGTPHVAAQGLDMDPASPSPAQGRSDAPANSPAGGAQASTPPAGVQANLPPPGVQANLPPSSPAVLPNPVQPLPAQPPPAQAPSPPIQASLPATAPADQPRPVAPAGAPLPPTPVTLDQPTVITTAELKSGDTTATLFGIEGLSGEPAHDLQSYLTGTGQHLSCEAQPGSGFVCRTNDGTDLAQVELVNGAAKARPDAPAAYKEQEAAAQAARRGIWVNLPPPPETVEHPAVPNTATLAVAAKTYALDGIQGLGQPYSGQLQGYISGAGDILSCQLQPATNRYICLLPDGSDVAKVALVNGAALVGPDAPDAYRIQQMEALNNHRGYWSNPPPGAVAAFNQSVPVSYEYTLVAGDDGADGITYVGGAPTAVIDGESVFLVLGAAGLGWGYYDHWHHWHGAPDRYRWHMDHFHPDGHGLRGYGHEGAFRPGYAEHAAYGHVGYPDHGAYGHPGFAEHPAYGHPGFAEHPAYGHPGYAEAAARPGMAPHPEAAAGYGHPGMGEPAGMAHANTAMNAAPHPVPGAQFGAQPNVRPTAMTAPAAGAFHPAAATGTPAVGAFHAPAPMGAPAAGGFHPQATMGAPAAAAFHPPAAMPAMHVAAPAPRVTAPSGSVRKN